MKKWISVFLCMVLMVTTLIGCGNSESGTASPAASKTNSGADDKATEQSPDSGVAKESSDTGNGSLADDDDEDIAKIILAFYGSNNLSDSATVAEAINEITIPAIHTEVELMPVEMGAWSQQLSLMIAGDEELDLAPTFFFGPGTFDAMYAQNQLMELNDLLDEYGQDILETLPEDYLKATTYDGGIYAIPVNADKVSNLYLNMRKDILEEIGMVEKAENIKSMSDVEEILAAVKDQTDLIPLAASSHAIIHFSNLLVDDKFEDAVAFDKLVGDYVVTLSTDPTKVVNLYETEEFKSSVAIIEDWFNKGYIHPDAATTDEDSNRYVISGKCFGYFSVGENATAYTGGGEFPFEMLKVTLASTPIATANLNTITWTIPVTSREPEAAMKFLNMMYSNKEIVDLLNYGIRDVHYVVDAEGHYNYPEGVDFSNTTYYPNMTWLFGNQYLAGPWGADPLDIREQSKRINENAKLSPILGFVADASEYSTVIAGLTSATSEFVDQIKCGVNSLENVDAMVGKMKSAGIDDLVAGVQDQLDTWLKDNK